MPDSIDPAERKKTMTLLEQYVTVSMQGERIDEAELMERLRFQRDREAPLPESDLETVARRLAERLAIDVDLGSVITSRDYEPWLKARKRDIEWGRWLAYKHMLIQQGRALTVIDKTENSPTRSSTSPEIRQSPDRGRAGGLVLGDVQSGKTGTYLALFNKAADAGYRLFILLAGNTEVCASRHRRVSTRRSSGATRPRSSRARAVTRHQEAHRCRTDPQGSRPSVGMTTVLRDFRRSSYEASNIAIQTKAAHPYVFVVKKNKNVLEALIAWLKEQATASGGMLSVPVMMLDDESDYASINTKSKLTRLRSTRRYATCSSCSHEARTSRSPQPRSRTSSSITASKTTCSRETSSIRSRRPRTTWAARRIRNHGGGQDRRPNGS